MAPCCLKIMAMRLLSRYEGYTLNVPAAYTASQINFPDIPELRSDMTQDTVIMSAAVYPAEAMPNDYNGIACATLAQIQNCYLTLYVLGFQQFYRIPLIDLVNIRNEGGSYYYSPEIFQFRPIKVDWTKSYVQFAVPPANEDTFSFMFRFGYEWLPSGAYGQYCQNLNNSLIAGVIPQG